MAVRRDISQVLGELAKSSGLPRGELSRRFHQIKSRGSTPGARDTNWIDADSGDVYDGPNDKVGDYIGNLFNDF